MTLKLAFDQYNFSFKEKKNLNHSTKFPDNWKFLAEVWLQNCIFGHSLVTFHH